MGLIEQKKVLDTYSKDKYKNFEEISFKLFTLKKIFPNIWSHIYEGSWNKGQNIVSGSITSCFEGEADGDTNDDKNFRYSNPYFGLTVIEPVFHENSDIPKLSRNWLTVHGYEDRNEFVAASATEASPQVEAVEKVMYKWSKDTQIPFWPFVLESIYPSFSLFCLLVFFSFAEFL